MTLFRGKRFLRSKLNAVKIPARAPFPVDSKLIERQETKARELGPNSIKRILVQDQPDTFKAPVHLDELPIG